MNDAGGQRWLRTGDLGFINDGELFVSGRLKDLIIVRGRNYYPHDLEYAVESATDALNPATTVAFSIDDGDGEKLIILAELKRNRIRQADYRGEFAAMRARLTEECGIQADRILLLKPGAILKTSSGKLRRTACRERFLDRGFEHVAADGLPTAGTALPMTANIGKDANERCLLRQALLSMPPTAAARQLAERLTLKAAELSGLTQDTIEPNQPLTGLGLDSLKAVEMKYFIDELLAVEIPITSLLGSTTLFDIALTALNLAGSAVKRSAECKSVGEVSDTTMPYNQQALWTRAKIDDGGLYHMPAALRIRGELNRDALTRALATLCRRHAQLRCGFELGADNRPLCLPLDRSEPSPERTDCSDEVQRREVPRVSPRVKIVVVFPRHSFL